MDVGVPKETFQGENRIALSPLAARVLTDAGHAVYLQAGAGTVSFYDDSSYAAEGATVVYNAEEVYGRGTLIAKIERPDHAELDMLQEGHPK